ncbi:unnamed protein product [Periconia digitata]|uniref:Uncharacterized protein n=1 Tax=Periconia digitata TaxID=1303443 RepID=A0A9W4UM41_9PLEO|nr:unnamed protein product [Periconia digitata]
MSVYTAVHCPRPRFFFVFPFFAAAVHMGLQHLRCVCVCVCVKRQVASFMGPCGYTRAVSFPTRTKQHHHHISSPLIMIWKSKKKLHPPGIPNMHRRLRNPGCLPAAAARLPGPVLVLQRSQCVCVRVHPHIAFETVPSPSCAARVTPESGLLSTSTLQLCLALPSTAVALHKLIHSERCGEIFGNHSTATCQFPRVTTLAPSHRSSHSILAPPSSLRLRHPSLHPPTIPSPVRAYSLPCANSCPSMHADRHSS